MRQGQDIAVHLPGLELIHHNLPGKRVGEHQWPQHAVFVPLQGEIRIRLASGSLVAGPGRMIYVPPKTLLEFDSSEAAGERLVCLIDAARWRRATSMRFGPTLCPSHQLCKEMVSASTWISVPTSALTLAAGNGDRAPCGLG